MTIIVLEIPHERPAQAWTAENESSLIKAACSVHNMIYAEWTRDNILDCWADEDDVPDDLLELLKNHQVVVEYGNSASVIFAEKEIAPSIVDVAKEVISNDLHSCHFLSLEEAKNFKCKGHQAVQAQNALDSLLEML